MNISDFSFGQPWLLLLIAAIPLLAWLLGRSGHPQTLRYSSLSLLGSLGRQSKFAPRKVLPLLRWMALALLIIGLAQPRIERSSDVQKSYGIDVVLVCDISPSMAYQDYMLEGRAVRRIDALVKAVEEFIAARPHDRTGMVGFAKEVFLLSPLTLDASWLPECLGDINIQGGTAIGEGIYGGVEVLKSSKEKSKVIIVVSDGDNNAGRSPLDAARYAKEQGIRVHTLSILSTTGMLSMKPGANSMIRIAETTGGQNFKASDSSALAAIYRHIDQLEKHRIEQQTYRLYTQLFPFVLVPALLLGLLEVGLRNTFLLSVP